MNAAQAERDDLQSKLTTTSRLLSEQVVKLKEQVSTPHFLALLMCILNPTKRIH